MKASKDYLRKNGIPEDHQDFLAIQRLLKNNTGYMLMFTKFRFDEQRSVSELTQLFTILQEKRQLLGELPKPAANYTDFNQLRFDIENITLTSSVKQFVQICPSGLKAIMRDNKEHWGVIADACSWFVGLETVKQRLFTKTISRYKSFNHVREALLNFRRAVNEGVDIFTIVDKVNKLEGAHLRFVDFDKNIALVRTSKKSAMVDLGRGTQWCIADAHQTYWQSHVRNVDDQQYILYDFNEIPHSVHSRIGVTNQGSGISHSHQNGNNAINIRKHCKNKGYDLNWFKASDDESKAEDVMDNMTCRMSDDQLANNLRHLMHYGYLHKFISVDNKTLNATKATKIFSGLMNTEEITEKDYNTVIVELLPIITSNKFFDKFMDSMHKLTIEGAENLKKKGLFFKYGIHLDKMLEKYYLNFTVNTTSEVVERNGMKFRKTVTFEPLNSLSLDVFNILLSTNPELVTNKALMFANDTDNLELFKVLLRNFNGTLRKIDGYKPTFRNEINEYALEKARS